MLLKTIFKKLIRDNSCFRIIENNFNYTDLHSKFSSFVIIHFLTFRLLLRQAPPFYTQTKSVVCIFILCALVIYTIRKSLNQDIWN